MNTIIKLSNIKKIFATEELETHALSDISFEIHKGEYVSISGPSGCGKSTLLSILGLLDASSEGSYQLNGQEIATLNNQQRAQIRNRHIGFVFQSFNLISDLSVEENVELPLTYRDDLTKEERKKQVENALSKVDMSHRAKHFPAQLSGGQQQRVAVARAIVGNPALILADEPTGNLDSKNAEQVMALLDQLHMDGATICMVTHDPRGAKRTDRVISISDGKIVSDVKNSPQVKASTVHSGHEQVAGVEA